MREASAERRPASDAHAFVVGQHDRSRVIISVQLVSLLLLTCVAMSVVALSVAIGLWAAVIGVRG